VREDNQEYKLRVVTGSWMKNSAWRKFLIVIWHLLILAAIILVILFWHTSLYLIGCQGDFSRMMEKVVILFFVLFLTSPLFEVLRRRLFPKTSAPRM
jgi:hypothetical protein